MMNAINTEFSPIKVWFTDQNTTGDLTGKKIAGKITSAGKTKVKIFSI